MVYIFIILFYGYYLFLSIYPSISLTCYGAIWWALCFTKGQKSSPRLISKLWHHPFCDNWAAHWLIQFHIQISHFVKYSHVHEHTPQGAFPVLWCPLKLQTLQGEERWCKDGTNISSILLIPSKNMKTMHQCRQNSSKESNHTNGTLTEKNIKKGMFWNES